MTKMPYPFWDLIKPTVADTLLAMAQAGVSVVPVGPNKKPLISWKAFQKAPASPDQVKEWVKEFPKAQIALVTGKATGWVVVDADSDDAVAWVDAELEKTPITQKTRKGKHYFYRWPGTKVKSTTGLGPDGKVDLRGDGGLIIIEPSVIDKFARKFEGTQGIQVDAVPVFDTSLLKPTKGRGRSQGAKGQAGSSQITRDPKTGKVTDGRDTQMMKLAFAILVEYHEQHGALMAEGDFAEEVWKRFSADADLTDGKWTKAQAVEKAAYTLERARHKQLPYDFADLDVETDSNQAKLMDVEDAKKLLTDIIEKFISPKKGAHYPDHVLLRAPPGIGKTTETIARAVADRVALEKHNAPIPSIMDQTIGSKYLLVTRGYQTALEAQSHIQKMLANEGLKDEAPILRGRDKPDASDKYPCDRWEEARKLGQKGYPIYSNLCVRISGKSSEVCPHFQSCDYMNAQRQARHSVMPIIYHAHLKSVPQDQPWERKDYEIDEETGELPAHLKDKFAKFQASSLTKIICDEDPTSSLIKTIEVPLQDIESIGIEGRHIANALSTRQPLLDYLKKKKVKAGELRQLAEQQNYLEKRGITKFSPKGFSAKDGAKIDELEQRYSIGAVIERIAKEIESGRSGDSYTTHLKQTNNGANSFVLSRARMQWPCPENRSLIIDGTAEPLILRQILPGLSVIGDINVQRKATVTQIKDRSFYKGSLISNSDGGPLPKKTELLKQAWQEICEIAKSGETLLVTNKKVHAVLVGNAKHSAISKCNGISISHFGAIRGVDAFKDFKNVVILGRQEPSVEEVENQAKAIWFDSSDPIKVIAADASGNKKFPRIKRPYVMRNPTGKSETGSVSYHPDKRVYAVLKSLREAESIQAVDRLRLIHRKAPANVYLFCNIPLPGIAVDRLVTWDEYRSGGSRIEQLLMIADSEGWDVISLKPHELAQRFPTLWQTQKAAEQWATKNPPDALNTYIRGWGFICSYRLPKQRGKASYAICKSGTDPEVELVKALGAQKDSVKRL